MVSNQQIIFLQQLLQCRFSPLASIPQIMSTMGPFRVAQPFRNRLWHCGCSVGHRSCQKTSSGVGYSLHGTTAPVRTLLQWELSMESLIPSGHIHLLLCGVLHCLQGQYLLHHQSPPAKSDKTLVFNLGQMGMICSHFCSPSSPSFLNPPPC